MAKPRHPFGDKYPSRDYILDVVPSFVYANLNCCGVKELHGVQNMWRFEHRRKYTYSYEQPTPAQQIPLMQDVMRGLEPRRPIWLFTDNDRNDSRGELLAKYIEDHKLGEVIRSGYHLNENSGNYIQMYTWIIDNEAFFAHKPEV